MASIHKVKKMSPQGHALQTLASGWWEQNLKLCVGFLRVI